MVESIIKRMPNLNTMSHVRQTYTFLQTFLKCYWNKIGPRKSCRSHDKIWKDTGHMYVFSSFSLLASQFLGLNYYISSELPNPPKKHRNICKLHAKYKSSSWLVVSTQPEKIEEHVKLSLMSAQIRAKQTNIWNHHKMGTYPRTTKERATRNLCHPQTFPPSEPHSHPFNN